MVKAQLDDEQLPAATSLAPRTYVQAGPGSGKTFLSVERFGWLRYHHLRGQTRGVAAVSFARSASSELRSRISQRWGPAALGWPAFAGTFDELLRSVLKNLLAHGDLTWPGGHVDLEIHETWRRFPHTKLQGQGHMPLRVVADSDGRIVPVDLGTWPKPRPYFTDAQKYVECLAEGKTTHDEVRSVLNSVLDGSGLDLSGQIGTYLSETFAHLLVDEAFDLNRLDARLLEVAADAGLPLTLVGDPWQSIFEWRGAAPAVVEKFVEDRGFEPFEVVGSHRYKTEEMRDLASKLVRGEAFHVIAAPADRVPSVALADRWMTLWMSDELPVLPCGLGKVDKNVGSAALTVLLHDLTMELFNEPTADIRNAVDSLNWAPDRTELVRARLALGDPSAEVSDVWEALRNGPAANVTWAEAGTRAGRYLEVLMGRIRSGAPLVRGLTVHQAKGLQWPDVDYMTELTEGPSWTLEKHVAGDRRMYVALTRAERSVRVRPLPQEVRTMMYHEAQANH